MVAPQDIADLDGLAVGLRELRSWAGSPSYSELARRIGQLRRDRGVPAHEATPGRVTVYDCFRTGRSRMDLDLVVDLVRALGLDDDGTAAWRQACRVALGSAVAGSPVLVRTDIPPSDPGFLGRERELAGIAALSGEPVAIVLVEGMAGVGKSWLALRAVQDRLGADDIRLYVDLQGHDPHRQPARAFDVLGEFLRVLDVPGDEVECLDAAGRAARYRELVAGQRLLMVLDNAATTEQVEPLLPAASARGLVVLTSRRRLTVPGTAVALDVFGPAESGAMLAAVAATRARAEPAAAARLADLCGHLPLDLALVCAHLRRTPDWTLADQVHRLEEMPRDELVRPALAASYRALPDRLRRVLRRLALHPGPDVTVHAAAALADLGLDAAAAALRALADEHLLGPVAGDRYACHDLIHAFARRTAADEDPRSVRDAALTRLLAGYCHTAATAVDLIAAYDRQAGPEVPDPGLPTPSFAGPDDAAGWLDRERTNLVSAATHAADHGLVRYTATLSGVLGGHLDRTSHWQDARALHTAALAVTDPAARARTLALLGDLDHHTGRYDAALQRYRAVLATAEETGQRDVAARMFNSIGRVLERMGRHDDALEHSRAALAVHVELGDVRQQAAAHGNIGVTLDSHGRYEEALEHYRQANELFAATGDRLSQARILGNIGILYEQTGRYQDAYDNQIAALESLRELGDRDGEAHVLSNLGLVCSRLGDHDRAIVYATDGLELFTRLGNRPGTAHAHGDLGRVLLAADRHDEAVRQLQVALVMARELPDPWLEEVVLEAIGTTDPARPRP